jgi:hypothetical protein
VARIFNKKVKKMEIVVFSWDLLGGYWPRYYINGKPYHGLISGRVYDRTVCRSTAGQITITEKELFEEE